jgi:hypothetical protein
MAKDLFRALRCFMVEFQDLSTYHPSNNVSAMHFLEDLPGKGEPRCAHMLDNTRLCQVRGGGGAVDGDGSGGKSSRRQAAEEKVAAGRQQQKGSNEKAWAGKAAGMQP